jgi:hypothetical protein
MRVTIQTRPGRSAKLAPWDHFFARDSHRRHIPRKQAMHVPAQRFDPVLGIVWLVLLPLSSALGWYGFIRTVMALWRWLW